MKILTMEVTPELAAEWLKENINNRKIRLDHVKKIAADIKAGKWILTGDAIRFSDSRLIDGQHRLLAIVQSGTTVETVVMFGVPDSAFDRIDQNKTRSASDILISHGISNPTECASVYKMVKAYEKGGASLTLQKHDAPSHSDVVENLKEHHRDAAKFGKQNRINGALPPSIIGTSWFICSSLDSYAATEFWSTVGTGQRSEILVTNNALQLRDRLLTHAAASKRMLKEHIFTWCVRAWNAERIGQNAGKSGFKFYIGEPIPRFI